MTPPDRAGTPPILAVVYGAGEDADPVMARLADRLREDGLRLAGLVQRNPPAPGRSRCNMEVEILPGGERRMISEDRGAAAAGCRLDPGLLIEALELARAGLEGGSGQESGADVLILNRFGKVEADGGGGREIVAQAVGQGIPVIVAVPWRNIAAFRAFAGALAAEVPLADVVAAMAIRTAAEEGPPFTIRADLGQLLH